MLRQTAGALAVLFLVPAISPVAAQPLPEGITMHRTGAGQLDDSGWTTAASTDGGFSVRLPLKFNDFTMEIPRKGPVSRMFSVGGKTMVGVKFAAMRIEYRDKGKARSYFSRFAKGEALKAESIKPLVFGGREAIDLFIKGARSRSYMRFVLLADSLVMLTVEFPRALQTLVPQGNIDKFFASLQITRP